MRWVVAGLLLAVLLAAGAQDDWETLASENEVRAYNGTGNNVDEPEWGSVGQRQLRAVTAADYTDGISTPPGITRPSPRTIMSDVFLATPSSKSTMSALFVGWGLLLGYDIFLNQDNATEALDVECNNAALADVWCPFGSDSDPISFNRSQGEIDTDGDGARSPINYATAFVDLDWLYGRSTDAADEIRMFEGGYLNLTDDELPHLLPDGSWLVADQRPARMPVTFALMTLLLREHNRCCDELAPDWEPASDQETYQFCRQWTIAVFQHITENDFSVRLLGGSTKTLGAEAYESIYDDDNDTVNARQRRRRQRRRRQRRLGDLANVVRSRYLAQTSGSYDVETNAGTDVLFSTVAMPAFYSALPSTVGLLDDLFDVMGEDGIELAVASADMAGLVERSGGIEAIIRGAAYSRAQAMDASFVAEVSVSSPLFNLPVEAVQRGRDHGVPTYNDAREAYGLERVTTFDSITSDAAVWALLDESYGDVDVLDAYTGALAEATDGSTLFAGPLLRAIFLEQLYRAIVGDRHHHVHTTQNEDAALSTITDLILDNANISDLPLDIFSATDFASTGNCSSEVNEVTLETGYKLKWGEPTDGTILMTISTTGIGSEGMVGIGFGGTVMSNTDDFIICEVMNDSTATCTDRSGPGNDRVAPPLDVEDDSIEFVSITIVGDWTSVEFARKLDGNDASDYPLGDDIDVNEETSIIYAWRPGPGINQHSNGQRGSADVNFLSGWATANCDDSSEYFALHGALLLLAWMLIAPYGIYQARYRKGKNSIIGNLWWEMHEECMVVCAEALLPLAITAIFTTGGPHNTRHAKWGFYMIAAVFLQLLSGYARARALEAKGNNFSLFHRVNKHFHIYSGWFAYAAGLVQCYRGLEMIAGTDQLVFSAVDIDITFANFNVVRKYVFPTWLGLVPPLFLVLEVRKQFKRYFTKGAANLCGVVELINEEFSDEAIKKEVDDRLMPRTEELPLYTTEEFNDKVLHGRSWIIVDGAILDVSTFAKRHPGGARLIINAMGTDITSEIMGEEASIGNSNMAFTPHPHTDTALEIARSLVVGYIEEEDDLDSDGSDAEGGTTAVADTDSSGRSSGRFRLHSSHSGSDSGGSGKRLGALNYRSARASSRGDQYARFGRLASLSGDNSDDSGTGARRMSFGVSSEERRKSFGAGNESRKQALSRRASLKVGAGVKLSEEAAAIVNAASPPNTERPSGDEEKGEKAAAPVRPPPPTIPRTESAPVGSSLSPPIAPSSSVGGKGGRKGSPSRSMSFMSRPVALEEPVLGLSPTGRGLEPAAEDVSDRKSRITSLQRMFKRLGSSMDPMNATSGDETDDAKEVDKPFKSTRRVWQKKNPLHFFHVCPLVLHEKMGDGAGRPVHKFVFACPGKAGALVAAMDGVCHFNMRLAQETGMTVVQRAYNAFAVRVVSNDNGERRVVPAAETTEGDLCIEMRIRLYPDGCMSNLLSQLIKNLDNPAVQLQGPFLQDRLIPPPTHRNVVMIAAGTGVNPMVQMIRDYLNLGSYHQGGVVGAHSRLVLLWQNSIEADLYCADELTRLQAKAKGLLEVTALISGDTTRRNVPGNAFRRAKARLMKKSKRNTTSPVPEDLEAGGGGGGGWSSVGPGGHGEDEKQPHDDFLPLHRLRLVGNLSRVTEEDSTNKSTRSILSESTFGSKEFDTGASHLTREESIEEQKESVSFTSRVPWWSGAGGGRRKTRGGGGSKTSSPSTESARAESVDPRGQSGAPTESSGVVPLEFGAVAGGDGLSGERSIGLARNNGGSRGSSAERDGGRVRGITRRDTGKGASVSSDVDDRRPSSRRNTGRGTSVSSDTDDRHPLSGERGEDSGPGKSDGRKRGLTRGGGGTRSSIRLADSLKQAGFAPGGRSKSVGKRQETPGGGQRGDGKCRSPSPVRKSKSPTRSPFGSNHPRIASIDYSSGEELKAAAAMRTESQDKDHSKGNSLPTSSSSSSSTRRRVSSAEPPGGDSRRSKHKEALASRAKRGAARVSSVTRSSRQKSPSNSPLEDSGAGLQHSKLTKEILKKALGPLVMKAIASARTATIGVVNLESADNVAAGTKSALRELVGSDTIGGRLQVVVSGPAGFVFHVESLLAELRIPPEVVVLLD